AFLDDSYIPDVHQRLSMYRRLSGSSNDDQLNALEEELADRFGPLPYEAQNLIWIIRLKNILKNAGIESMTVGPERLSLTPGSFSRLDPARAATLVGSRSSAVR